MSVSRVRFAALVVALLTLAAFWVLSLRSAGISAASLAFFFPLVLAVVHALVLLRALNAPELRQRLLDPLDRVLVSCCRLSS